MTDPRIVAASRVDDDAQYETGLRPRTLRDYIGQERLRENLTLVSLVILALAVVLFFFLSYYPMISVAMKNV